MKCWYCKKETMVEAPDLGSGWFRCSECGATWNKLENFRPAKKVRVAKKK